MPPFSMLRTKKSRKLRPRTPPSPGSFYAPARSPAPWTAAPLLNRVRSNSEASGSGAGSAQDPQGSRQQGSLGRRAPPSAWGFTEVEKSLPRPPQRSASHAPALQLELGAPQDSASWFHSEPEAPVRVHSRRPSGATSSPKPPALEPKPSPLESRSSPFESRPSPLESRSAESKPESVSGPNPVVPHGEQSVSGPKSAPPTNETASTPRRVPSPIKIPRTHVHAPSVTIERTPSPSSSGRHQSSSSAVHQSSSSHNSLALTSTPTSELTSPDPSSESAPELLTVFRAERASAAMLGLGFTLRARDGEDMAGALRMDSATLPQETQPEARSLRRSTSTDEGLAKGVAPPGTYARRRESVVMPAPRPETVYASSSRLEPPTLPWPGRPETVYAVPSGIHSISEVPSTPSSSQLQSNPSSSPARSPTRLRSKTVAAPGESRRDNGRELYVTVGRPGESSLNGNRQRSATVDTNPRQFASPGYSTIKRSRSPSGATATTYPSRPETPPDAIPALPRAKAATGTSTLSAQATPSPSSPAGRLAYLDSPSSSPPVRTTRLQSAPTATGSSPPGPSMLSKFARSQMSFENFSFLGRGRSVSEVTRVADGEVSPGSTPPLPAPVRPARPPSLTLRDDPPDQPRLVHSNSGSSTGSFRLVRSGSNGAARVGPARLRRKRSSPRQGTKVLVPDRLERSASGSTTSHHRNGSIARDSPLPRADSTTPHRAESTLQRTDSSSGSHRTAGTQQPTPTSTGNSPPPVMTLKQRRETIFPTTPRSFSHESALLDSPAVPELPGFVLDGNLLMPIKSPASVMSGAASVAGSTRKAHLPIGPKQVPVPAPVRAEVPPPVIPTPGPSTGSKTSTARLPPKQQPPSAQPKQPPSPTFEPIPVRWRGLTMDAAKWTFSSNQLHSIVSRAIKQSAETSSVRLLPLDVLDQEIPVEIERLEQLRDVLQTKYKAQVRRRRLLMRSLALYIDGHDPPTSRRLLDELEDVGVVCDQLAEDLYLVGDQLSQIARLRDVHNTSALAVALRKINQSYIRARSEVVELQAERTSLEAERDEAWVMAESLERELVEVKHGGDSTGDTESSGESRSRVSAARKSSVRQSKMSLRRSLRRSYRSSTSGGSMRYHSIIFPRPPTTAPSFVESAPDTSGEFVPPVPPVPTPSKHLSTMMEPSRPESIGVLPSGVYALSPGAGSSQGEPYSVVGVPTPSATSHDLFVAQNELLKMLGLSYKEYGFKIRPRSYSDSSPLSSPPVSPNAHLHVPPSAYGARGKLLRSTSDQALRRHSSVDRVIAVEVPASGGVPEDPAAILAALTLPQDDL